jgi:allantoin racemase
MSNTKSKIMYLSPVGVDSLDDLFYQMISESKNPNSEVHITSLDDRLGSFSHVEFRSYEAMATPGIIHATIAAAEEGFDAFVIGCFYDTALFDAREVSDNMVVVAPCHSSIETALSLANNFAIIVGRRKWVNQMTNTVAEHGYKEKLAGFFDVGMGVDDFQKDHNKTIEALTKASIDAVENHYAESIILGCTAEFGFYKDLQKIVGVPVIDPSLASLKKAEQAAELKKNFNLVPSRKWSCEPPSKKEIEKFKLFAEKNPFGNRIVVS